MADRFEAEAMPHINDIFRTATRLVGERARAEDAVQEVYLQVSLSEAELNRIFEREPLLIAQDGEPHFVARSLDAFEAMVRRLRQLETTSRRQLPDRRGNLILHRP